MKKLLTLASILTLSMSLAACNNKAPEQVDDEYNDVMFFVDPDTKCQYVVTGIHTQGTAITPRMNPDGTQFCDQ